MSWGLIAALLLAGSSAGARVERLPSWAAECLNAHNKYRAEFGCPKLTWSSALAARSEQWAVRLIRQGRYELRRDGVFGENLFEISGGLATPSQVISAWMAEEANYRTATNSCSARCGHFTQVVWYTTQRVGCGAARDKQREVWVCNYDPPGNVQGERPY